MKRGKRFLSLMLSLVIALSVFIGSMPTTAFAAATTLKTVSMFGGNDPAAPAYSALIKTYADATGIKIQDASDVAIEDWKASVITDFNTGNEPDVIFFFNGVDAAPILKKVVDVNTIRAKYPTYAKDVTKSAIEAVKESDGKAYCIPVKGFWEGIYCNKDLFDKYKLDLPTDWAKLTKAIETFRKNGIDPFSISFAEEPHYMIEALILSAGGVKEHSVNPGTNVKSVPASWEKGLNMFKTFGEMKAFPADAATKKTALAQDDFYKKKAAMLVDGSWRTGGVIAAGRKDDVVVVPFPKMPGGKGTGTEVVAGFSSGFYITQKAWKDPVKQKAAVDFINYMTSKASISMLMANGAGAPAADIPTSGGASLVMSTGTKMAGSASGSDMPIDSRLKKAAWADIWTKVGDIASGKTTASAVLSKAIPQNK